MSVNHYTQELHNHNSTNNLFSNNQNDTVYNNQNQYDAVQSQNQYDAVRVSLFEKSLTPSDVGKLNRLVIPKQHAEKHFPLNNVAAAGEAATAEEKGPALMLSFEDESTGKNWEFRYSYWNSSQSYVLTKGWSRYVKHKRLDAGDVIFFKRHRYDLHRLFIGWRRRGGEANSSSTLTTSTSTSSSTALLNNNNNNNTTAFWNGVMPYRQTHVSTAYSNHLIHPEYSHYGGAVEAQSTPTGTMSSRTVRLFGVNLECEQLNDGDVTVSAVAPPYSDADGYQGQHSNYYYSTPHRMNISFGGESMEQVRR